MMIHAAHSLKKLALKLITSLVTLTAFANKLRVAIFKLVLVLFLVLFLFLVFGFWFLVFCCCFFFSFSVLYFFRFFFFSSVNSFVGFILRWCSLL